MGLIKGSNSKKLAVLRPLENRFNTVKIGPEISKTHTFNNFPRHRKFTLNIKLI